MTSPPSNPDPSNLALQNLNPSNHAPRTPDPSNLDPRTPDPSNLDPRTLDSSNLDPSNLDRRKVGPSNLALRDPDPSNLDHSTLDLRTVDLRDHDRVATGLCLTAVEAVKPNQLDLPTPCADWNLGELVAHLVAENRGFATIARGANWSAQLDKEVRFGLEMWRPGPPDEITLARFPATVEALAAAYADDAILDLALEVREFGIFPGRVAVGMHFLDYLVHAWDVARSIGLPNPIPEDLAEIALHLGVLIPAERPDGGVFAPVVPIDPEAPASERLLGLVGRDPKWSGA